MFTFSATSKVFLTEFSNFYEIFEFNITFSVKEGCYGMLVIPLIKDSAFINGVCVTEIFCTVGKFVALKGFNQVGVYHKDSKQISELNF